MTDSAFIFRKKEPPKQSDHLCGYFAYPFSMNGITFLLLFQSFDFQKLRKIKAFKDFWTTKCLFKLGKSKDIFKHICLVFIFFLPLFYLCYIYYFGSLIFCCQFVAIKSILSWFWRYPDFKRGVYFPPWKAPRSPPTVFFL